jgi:hypothetical protein
MDKGLIYEPILGTIKTTWLEIQKNKIRISCNISVLTFLQDIFKYR